LAAARDVARIEVEPAAPAPDARWLAFASCFLTHAYFCAVVSNDALSWLARALVIERIVALDAETPAIVVDIAAAGALLARCSPPRATKSSLLVSSPARGARLCCKAIRRRSARMGLEGLAVLVVAVAVAHPWYVLNLHRYGTAAALDMGFGPPHADA